MKPIHPVRLRPVSALIVATIAIASGCDDNQFTMPEIPDYGVVATCVDYSGHMRHVGTNPDLDGLAALQPLNEDRWVGVAADRLVVLDLADPAAPVVTAEAEIGGRGVDLLLDGHIGFVTNMHLGLQVVDVENPASVKLRSTTPAFGYPRAVAFRDPYVYLCLENASLLVFDVSLPIRPVLVATLSEFSDLMDMVIKDGHAYVLDQEIGVRVLDLSDPAAPVVVSTMALKGQCYQGKIQDDLLFVAARDAGLTIFDISDPPVMDRLFDGDPNIDGYEVEVWGDYAILGHHYGIKIFDISDPTDAEQSMAIACNDGSTSLSLFGNHLYAAHLTAWDGKLRIFELNRPVAPETVGNFDDYWSSGRCVEYADQRAFLGHGDRLSIFDLSEVSEPDLLTRISFNNVVHGVVVEGDIIFVLEDFFGLRIFDISSTEVVQALGTFSGIHPGTGIAKTGHFVYIPQSYGGLQVIDVSDLHDPVSVGFLALDDNLDGMALGEGLLYVAAGGAGVHVLDISSPEQPRLETTVDLPGSTKDVCLRGDLLFAASGTAGLHIMDLADPASPFVIGSWVSLDDARGVHASESFCYLADDQAGMSILDLSDPANPRSVGLCSQLYGSRDVTAAGDYLLLATGRGMDIAYRYCEDLPANP